MRALSRLAGFVLLVVLPRAASAQFCTSNDDCGCAEYCAGICLPGCTSDSRCAVNQECVAGVCVSCGGNLEFDCPLGDRCVGSQTQECENWKNRAGGGCANCGKSGQPPCYVAGFLEIPGVVESYPGGLACDLYLTPNQGTSSCIACGTPGAPICSRQLSPPLNDLCQPAYSPITDEDSGGDPTCYDCGGDGEFTCTHSAQARCDPARAEFSLDPVRAQVEQGIRDALPASIESMIPPAAYAAVDACWDRQLPSFAIDPPVEWPSAESTPGPRTFVQIHGRNGGGFDEAPSGGNLGTRNSLQYRVDYNAGAEGPLPFRIWAWDELGQPYVAYQSESIVSFPGSYDFTLRQVADFVYDALLRLPVEGELILQGQSMGGYVIKDLLRRRHDQLRFRGRPISEMIFTSHPHFGIVLDPAAYTPFLCSGFAERYSTDDPKGIAQDCKSGRWMIAWNESGASIDDQAYPHVKWATGSGDCDLDYPGSGCLCQPEDPPTCQNVTIEVPPPGSEVSGFEPPGFVGWANLDGDGLFNIDSGLGIDTYGNFSVDPLVFDLAAVGDCRHVTSCGVQALQALDPALYTDAVVCGDVTVDGTIDAADLTLVRESLAGLTTLPEGGIARCSVGFDGPGCDVADVVHLARAFANQENAPVGPGLQQSCAAAADLTRGLVLYLPFDAAPLLNHAPSGETLDALLGGSPQPVPGKVGGALDFDASGDQVRVEDAVALAALRGYSQWSLQAWIRPLGVNSTGVFLNKAGEFELGAFPGGPVRFAIAPEWTWRDTGLVAPSQQWSHVVLVFDALAARSAVPNASLPLPYRLFDGEIRAYVNGVEAVQPWTFGEVGDDDPGQHALAVAGIKTSPNDRFPGEIDEVAMWQRPLSPLEVALLYNGGAGRAIESTVFDPATLAPSIWLDAADPSVFTLAGGEVLGWADKSGNGFHVAPVSTTPARVVNGQNGNPTVRLDGAADVLCSPASPALSLSTALTLVVVARNDVRKSYNGLFSVRESTSVTADLELYWQQGTSGSGNLVYLTDRGLPTTGNLQAPNAGPPAGSFYLATVTVDAAASQGTLRVDGATVASGGAFLPSASNRICVGLGFGAEVPGNALDGDVAELLVFDRVLSPGELDDLEGWLARKWGL